MTEGQARERDPVQTLLASVQYELKRDCCNFQGEQQAFDQYLVRRRWLWHSMQACVSLPASC